MSTRPTCKAVNSRPSTETLGGITRRRTSAQVKKALEDKLAAIVALEESNDSAKRQKQEHIAHLEDKLRKEDLLYEKQSVRPDLQYPETTTLTKWPERETASAQPEDADGLGFLYQGDLESEVVANEGNFLFFSHNPSVITPEKLKDIYRKVWLTYLKIQMSTQKATVLG